ncbi:hypothetical protein YL93_22270 [Salmonella enterica subsp. enterica serovar Montevideo]|uniref:Uncharacterized protein n=1 Tax=Salmonella enterica subsp. enterica serovar Nima TaxID=940233 RepID=A0A5V8WML1_SALET|nr:hypothetical protein [Salmonella enterica subsp. enterica serovar Cairina]EBQ9208224.1 hypothetical protein [Salmonella enterica subsp. enterica serovar Anecho]EBU8757073.1 hypothetical protein [Salmonella enterica subsp. enterica serovar Offa]EBV2360851.1 hypothetical protein [Salmonella enterica subsp. enterica serovar Ago]EBV4572145.1 hypothetical protein [Salmonella enterica subsp. enterica serovar Nima]EBY3010435.1 hypothetical protein [Salmonella enterica subsp. enterica serovar Ekpou
MVRLFFVLFSGALVFAANADTRLYLQEKSRSTSEAVISSVSSSQKLRDKKLRLQLQIDELRVKIGGTMDPQKKVELQQKMDSLVKQMQSIR